MIVPPILPEVSSNLDVAETAESHVANVPTSSSLSDSVQNEQAGPSHSLQVVAATSADLGIVVQAAKGCWGTLRRLVSELSDAQRMQYLTCHTKPATGVALHSHPVTKGGKTWHVPFQPGGWNNSHGSRTLTFLKGEFVGIASFSLNSQKEEVAILFPEQPKRGGSLGAIPGSLVLTVYQSPYNKALGKDGIFACHVKSIMHCHATKQADLFLLGVRNPDSKDINRGNFVAILQLMAKGNSVLQKHLSCAKRNATYTSKTIQNDLIHIYATQIKEKITGELRSQNLPFTIIADECTDRHSNQEILSVCLRFVSLLTPKDPQIKECLVDFLHLERATATTIATKLLESLTSVSLSLNPSNIRGQAYDGAAVMSSEKAGVQAKIKEVSPLAFYTHCYCHCLNLSLASACQVQDIRNLIGTINEAYLFLSNSPKRQRFSRSVFTYMLQN